MSWKEQVAGLAVLTVLAGGGYGVYHGVRTITSPVVHASVSVPVKPQPIVKEVKIVKKVTKAKAKSVKVDACVQVRKARSKGASDEYIARWAQGKGYNYDRALARIRNCK